MLIFEQFDWVNCSIISFEGTVFEKIQSSIINKMNEIMKKMRLSALVVMLAIVASASAQVGLGIKGGVNMSNFYGDELSDKNAKIGFHVGIAADYEFMPNMAIQSGLFFVTKGAKYSGSLLGVTGDVIMNPMYLQVPVHFAYKMDATPGTRIVFHAGPYVAYGVAGKSKLKLSAGDKSTESDGVAIFGDKGSMKPFDAGLGLGVGAEFGPILVDLGWDMGLVNVAKAEKANTKNQNAYLSVGYRF